MNIIRLVVLMVMTTVLVGTSTATAAFRTTVTKSENFEQVAEFSRVAVVTVECYKVVDCSAIERKVFLEALKLKLPFKITPERIVRNALFSLGHTEYNTIRLS